jgi:hypothetical protein
MSCSIWRQALEESEYKAVNRSAEATGLLKFWGRLVKALSPLLWNPYFDTLLELVL